MVKIMSEKAIQHETLKNIGYGLYVLSARDNNKDNACIVNSFMQVTDSEKPLCVLAVNKRSLTHDMILSTGEFNISVITVNATSEMFKHFGFQSGRSVDKFLEYKEIDRSSNGTIYITKNTNAFLSLKVKSQKDLNSHTLFTAELTESAVLDSAESVTYSYYHQKIKSKGVKNMGYRCTICDFVLEEETLPEDYICPVCGYEASAFIKV